MQVYNNLLSKMSTSDLLMKLPSRKKLASELRSAWQVTKLASKLTSWPANSLTRSILLAGVGSLPQQESGSAYFIGFSLVSYP